MKVNLKSNFLKSASGQVLYWIDIIWRRLEYLAIRRVLAVVLIGLLSFAGSSMVGALSGVPKPRIHDEFSYLLAADTFAKGRLSNPTHPMWVHFESFHINHQPTYMSKYPPAQGLILAVGQIIGGHPIWGVWISTALMCAAICWMLYGWIPPKWAFLGGLLTVIQLGIMTYWSQSYFGGAVAASGGALVFGALRRIIRRQYARDALLMGLGLAVLANSRPWEGMIASIPVFAMLFFWMFGKNHLPFRKSFVKVILPISFVLILTAAWIGVYNHAVTGNALRMPYFTSQEKIYGKKIFLLWQKREAKSIYRHKIMQRFHEKYGVPKVSRKKSVRGFFGSMLDVAKTSGSFYFGGLLIIPMIMIMLPWVLKSKWMRLALITGVIFTALTYIPTSYDSFPHYLAPFASIIILFVAQGLRCMYFLRLRRKSIGKIIVLIFLSVFITQKVHPVVDMLNLKYLKKNKVFSLQNKWENWMFNKVKITKGVKYDWASKREEIIKEFKKNGGRHLIIVRYGPNHYFHYEWVYNEADIDNASVVWAREMDMNQNRNLLEYFKDRTAWLLKVEQDVEQDKSPPKLLAYPDIDATKNN